MLTNSSRVRPETRARIEQAIQECGYRPNALARGLVHGSTHTLGLVVHDLSNPFFALLARGARPAAQARGYHLLLTESGGDIALERECLAMLIRVQAACADGKVTRVTFRNVPAFAAYLDAAIDVPHLGRVTVDVAYGGMFYVIADAEPLGVRLVPEEGREIVRVSEMITAAAREQLPVVHPENPGFARITIAQLSGPPLDPANHRRNVVTVSTGVFDWAQPATWTGVIDRSPCGTGTCAKMAVLHAKGALGLQQDFRHEGILGTVFTGRLVEETAVGPHAAAIPTLSGQAWITGLSTYTLDSGDPFPERYTVGDLW